MLANKPVQEGNHPLPLPRPHSLQHPLRHSLPLSQPHHSVFAHTQPLSRTQDHRENLASFQPDRRHLLSQPRQNHHLYKPLQQESIESAFLSPRRHHEPPQEIRHYYRDQQTMSRLCSDSRPTTCPGYGPGDRAHQSPSPSPSSTITIRPTIANMVSSSPPPSHRQRFSSSTSPPVRALSSPSPPYPATDTSLRSAGFCRSPSPASSPSSCEKMCMSPEPEPQTHYPPQHRRSHYHPASPSSDPTPFPAQTRKRDDLQSWDPELDHDVVMTRPNKQDFEVEELSSSDSMMMDHCEPLRTWSSASSSRVTSSPSPVMAHTSSYLTPPMPSSVSTPPMLASKNAVVYHAPLEREPSHQQQQQQQQQFHQPQQLLMHRPQTQQQFHHESTLFYRGEPIERHPGYRAHHPEDIPTLSSGPVNTKLSKIQTPRKSRSMRACDYYPREPYIAHDLSRHQRSSSLESASAFPAQPSRDLLDRSPTPPLLGQTLRDQTMFGRLNAPPKNFELRSEAQRILYERHPPSPEYVRSASAPSSPPPNGLRPCGPTLSNREQGMASISRDQPKQSSLLQRQPPQPQPHVQPQPQPHLHSHPQQPQSLQSYAQQTQQACTYQDPRLPQESSFQDPFPENHSYPSQREQLPPLHYQEAPSQSSFGSDPYPPPRNDVLERRRSYGSMQQQRLKPSYSPLAVQDSRSSATRSSTRSSISSTSSTSSAPCSSGPSPMVAPLAPPTIENLHHHHLPGQLSNQSPLPLNLPGTEGMTVMRNEEGSIMVYNPATDTATFRCELCPSESFGRIHDLKRHQTSKHQEMTWPCDFCHRPFVRRDALLRHYTVKAARDDGIHPASHEVERLMAARARAKMLY